MNLNDDYNLFDKIWQVATLALGGLFSYLVYRKKKDDEHEQKQEDRLRDIELKQIEYNSTVEHILKFQEKLYQEFQQLKRDLFDRD